MSLTLQVGGGGCLLSEFTGPAKRAQIANIYGIDIYILGKGVKNF